jgi:hypothetical protein
VLKFWPIVTVSDAIRWTAQAAWSQAEGEDADSPCRGVRCAAGSARAAERYRRSPSELPTGQLVFGEKHLVDTSSRQAACAALHNQCGCPPGMFESFRTRDVIPPKAESCSSLGLRRLPGH